MRAALGPEGWIFVDAQGVIHYYNEPYKLNDVLFKRVTKYVRQHGLKNIQYYGDYIFESPKYAEAKRCQKVRHVKCKKCCRYETCPDKEIEEKDSQK